MSNRDAVSMTQKQREELSGWLRRPTLAAGLAKRARAMLLLADGYHVSETAQMVSLQRRHLYKWIERFRKQGVEGLHDGKRSGRPPVFSPRDCDARREIGLRTAG